MANNDQVTLVFTRPFSPYNEGDVATFDKATAEKLQNPTYIDDKGRERPLEAGSPVEVYSESKHKDQLLATRGKEKDDQPIVPNQPTTGFYTAEQLETMIQQRLRAERDRAELNASPLSADPTKLPVNREQQAAGTVVTDPEGISDGPTGKAHVDELERQKEASQKIKGDQAKADKKSE